MLRFFLVEMINKMSYSNNFYCLNLYHIFVQNCFFIICGPRVVDLIHFLYWLLRMFFGLYAGLVETDPEGALAGFAEVVRMEQEKAEW